MNKWVKIFIAFLFIVLIIALFAFAYDPFGQALHDFGVNTLGPGLMGSLTALVTVPLAWGASSLLYGTVVIISIVAVWTLVWTLVLKRVWNKTKDVLHIGTTTTTPAPTAYPTMTGPQTVIVKEVPVTTAEKKEEAKA